MSFQAPAGTKTSAIRAGFAGLIAGGLACLWPAIASPATLPTEHVIAGWRQQSQHPLVGKIWVGRDNRLVDAGEMSRGNIVGSPVAEAVGIMRTRYLLLGEIHDNREHHLLRAGLIDAVIDPEAAAPIVGFNKPLPADASH